jgi:dTDP-4-dehydrorhamnose reductase
MRVLVLGASGMLGNAILRLFCERHDWVVYGTLRVHDSVLQELAPRAQILDGINADQPDSLISAFRQSRPQVVINCIGLVKQLASAQDPLEAIPINSILPHRLAQLCELMQARLIHISTDCVFSGIKGNYRESDFPDAQDLYGRSKLIGEVNCAHAITLRTSIIGPELHRNHGLISWLLSQQGQINGHINAIFSGLPSCELARVVRDFVIPNEDLSGIYNVVAEPISKYNLLQLVTQEYGKVLQIKPDDKININRSLDGTLFRQATGYIAPSWPQLIAQMRSFEQLGKIV